jgi:branched-chain amino acid transport system substrate-binding protein
MTGKRNSHLRWAAMVMLSLLVAGLLAACGDNTPTPAPAATTAAASGATNTTATSATTQAAGAASTAGNTTGVTDTEIVLGSWGPQSGPVASWGVAQRVMEAYFKKINDEGGINGRKVKFLYQDDAYQASQTQAVVKKLAEQDKVFAFTGGIGTANQLAVMDYLVQNNIPDIAPLTGSTLLSRPVRRNVFPLQANFNTEATMMTQYAIDKLNAKKIAIVYQDDPSGKEALQTISNVVKTKGQTVVTSVSYQPTDKDFASTAIKLQQSGADTVYMWSVPVVAASVAKEMDKLAYKPTLVVAAFSLDPTLFKLSDNTVDGIWTAGWLPDVTDLSSKDPKVVQYREFMTKYAPNEPPNSNFAAIGYAAAQLTAEGLKRAGKDLTREKLIQTLESMKDWKEGLPYNISYGSDNREGQLGIVIYQGDAKAGKFIQKTDYLEFKP